MCVYDLLPPASAHAGGPCDLRGEVPQDHGSLGETPPLSTPGETGALRAGDLASSLLFGGEAEAPPALLTCAGRSQRGPRVDEPPAGSQLSSRSAVSSGERTVPLPLPATRSLAVRGRCWPEGSDPCAGGRGPMSGCLGGPVCRQLGALVHTSLLPSSPPSAQALRPLQAGNSPHRTLPSPWGTSLLRALCLSQTPAAGSGQGRRWAGEAAGRGGSRGSKRNSHQVQSPLRWPMPAGPSAGAGGQGGGIRGESRSLAEPRGRSLTCAWERGWRTLSPRMAGTLTCTPRIPLFSRVDLYLNNSPQ